MGTAIQQEIADFVKERDEMLLACDVDRMLAFYKKHNPELPMPSEHVVAEMMLHKARTGVKSLPRDERMKSARWLKDRGYTTLDDDDLNDA